MKNFFSLGTSLFLLFWSLSGKAAIITSAVPGGNWSQAGSWQGGVVPGSNDTVRIVGGSSLILDQFTTIRRLVFVNDTASSTVRLIPGGQLVVSGAVLMGNPTRDNRRFLLDVDSGRLEAGSVTYTNSGGDSRRGIIRISSGTMQVNGLFDMSSERFSYVRRRIEITGNGLVLFLGGVQNPATITTAPGSTVFYQNDGPTALLFGDYHNLFVFGSGVKTLGVGTTVNESLRIGGGRLVLNGALTLRDSVYFQNGIIDQGNFNVTLSGNYTLTGNFGAENHINQNGSGILQIVGDSAARFLGTFPIGANGKYTPVTISELRANFPGSAGSRNMEIKTFGLRHPVLTGSNNAANRFFRIRTNNITVVNRFAATLTYSDADVAAPIQESALTTVGRLRTGNWQTNFAGSSVNTGNNQLVLDTLNNLIDGDYTLGEPSAFPSTVPYVFSTRNGNWGTASVWSTGAVPTAAQDVVVLHSIDDFDGSCDSLSIEQMGVLTARQMNSNLNGPVVVKGVFNDAHSGGVNTFLGKLRVESGATFIGSGSGSGASFTFANDIENNGRFEVGSNTIRFSRQVKNVIRISGTRPVEFFRTQANMFCLVDTLVCAFAASPSNPARFEPNLIVGDSNLAFNCHVLNRTALLVNNLTSRPATGFQRGFIQGQNAYLGFNSTTVPFTGTTGILDAQASENTVEFRAPSSQNIPAQTYFNLALSGDRSDRFKTILPGADLICLGDLTINNDASMLQFSATSANQTLRVNRNFRIFGNGGFRSAASGTVQNRVEIGGALINQSNRTFAFDAKVTDTTSSLVRFTGSGSIASGSGSNRFHTLVLSGTDTLRWDGSGDLEVDDTLRVNSPFVHRAGRVYIPNSARVTFDGSSAHTRLQRLVLTDRADRTVAFFQRIPLEVDSLFHMIADGRPTLGAFYNFAGQSLKINGEFRFGANGGSSGLRADSLSTLHLSGGRFTNSLALAPGFRRLKVLIHDKAANPLSISQPVQIFERLDLFNGTLAGTANIRMSNGATVRRTLGSVSAAFANTSGRYNVEYWRAASTGPEALGLPALRRVTLRVPEGDTLTVANTPTLDSNLVVISGQMKSTLGNYMRLNASSFVEIADTLPPTVLTVGTPTTPVFLGVALPTLASGKVLLKPVLGTPPNLPPIATTWVNRYVTVGGNAAGFSLSLGFSYRDADVNGTQESSLATGFWNGSDWAFANGLINPVTNTVAMTGISQTGHLAAWFGEVSVQGTIQSKTLQVFPNPTRDKLLVSSSQSLEVPLLFDVLGKSVGVPVEKLGNQYRLNLEELRPGIYFLSVQENGRNEIVRIVKN